MPEKRNVSNEFSVVVDKNSIQDEGDGTIQFNPPLLLSDETVQVNGTKYDHSTTDLSEFRQKGFSDHGSMLGYTIETIVGKWLNIRNESGKLLSDGFRFALKNPKGRLAYDLVTDGFLDEVSIGTRGPDVDDENTYRNHKVVEASWVGLGNNLNSKLSSDGRQLVMNSIDKYEQEGMDVAPLRKMFTNEEITNKGDSMAETKKNQVVKEDDDKQEDTPAEAPKETPKEEPTEPVVPETPAKEEDDAENKLAKMVENAVKPLKDEVAKYKQAFDEGAQEPKWQMSQNAGAPQIVKGKTNVENTLSKIDPWERAGLQFVNYCKAQKGDGDAAKELRTINEFHLDQLQGEGIVANTLTLGDFGNFVTSPEMQSEMEGFRTDYSEVLRAFPYSNTNSRDFQWLTRSGDISFEDVDGLDDSVGTDTLKPVSEYSGTVTTSRLQELAAVTPISTTANLFMAVDLIRDAAIGYRTEADRRLAQLPIARLEQAMEEDATRSVEWDTGSQTTAQKFSNLRTAIASISQGNGVLVMSEASHFLIYDLLHQSGAGSGLTESIVNGNPARSLWGRNLVVVPNDLMPTLDDSSTYRSITQVRPVAGGSPVTVTVNHGIFYVNPQQNWVGRTNGNLRYDLSTEASYESGGSTYSAFARNEVLLRGAVFRGGAIKDKSRIKGVRAEAVIS